MWHQAIILSNVHAIVGEWIPFGANQIVALNERLGSMDRCQVGRSHGPGPGLSESLMMCHAPLS